MIDIKNKCAVSARKINFPKLILLKLSCVKLAISSLVIPPSGPTIIVIDDNLLFIWLIQLVSDEFSYATKLRWDLYRSKCFKSKTTGVTIGIKLRFDCLAAAFAIFCQRKTFCYAFVFVKTLTHRFNCNGTIW